MGFFNSLFKVATGAGNRLLDPAGIWGDGGKGAAAAEDMYKAALAESKLAREQAAAQAAETLAFQKQHEESLKNIEAEGKKLSAANTASDDAGIANVIAGGSALAANALLKKKRPSTLSASMGIYP